MRLLSVYPPAPLLQAARFGCSLYSDSNHSLIIPSPKSRLSGDVERKDISPLYSIARSMPFYSKSRKYLHALENTKPKLLARFPNLAALQSVNLIMGFTIIVVSCRFGFSAKNLSVFS